MFIWRHRPPGTDQSVDPVGWLDAPDGSWSTRVALGIAVPLVLLIAGIYCIATRHGWLIGSGWHEFHGPPAVALGVAALGAATFFHAHAFWGPVYRLAIIHQLGRVLGAATFLAGFGYVLWSLLWLGG